MNDKYLEKTPILHDFTFLESHAGDYQTMQLDTHSYWPVTFKKHWLTDAGESLGYFWYKNVASTKYMALNCHILNNTCVESKKSAFVDFFLKWTKNTTESKHTK